jgi:hypothetical protein
MLCGFTESAGPLLGESDALPTAQPAIPIDNQINPAIRTIERISLHAFPYRESTSTHT